MKTKKQNNQNQKKTTKENTKTWKHEINENALTIVLTLFVLVLVVMEYSLCCLSAKPTALPQRTH